MADVDLGGMVTKQLTEATLEAGEVRLTEREAEALALPPRSCELVCMHDGDEVLAAWRGPELTIGGEALAETLTMWGQIGGLLRLQRTGECIELDFASAPRPTVLSGTPARWSSSVSTRAPHADATGRKLRRSNRQARESRFRIRGAEEYHWHGNVGIHHPTVERFVENIAAAQWDPPNVFDLRLRGERLSAVNDFDELLAVDLADVDHMPHQERTALKALGVMRGRAILADEVGLGKTIEAGLIMKELVLRGLARRILVLCPATLRDQWHAELKEKFDEDFDVIVSGNGSLSGDRLILSHQLATLRREALCAQPWDLVIVDEAHRMAGKTARKRRALLEALESRFTLFLTATPVSGDLFDLYRLVELLRPGTFRSEREFRQRYVDPDNKRLPRDPQALRRLVADVMIRTTREQAGLDHVTRHAVDVPIELSLPERQAYDVCTDLLRHVMRDQHDHFRRRNLAQRLTASPRALAVSARKMAKAHPDPSAVAVLSRLADLCEDFGLTNRQQRLLDLIGRWTADRRRFGKVLVFSQTYETVHDLLRILDEQGIDAVAYHGGLAPSARQRAIERFRSDCPVMVSTDAGAEGLNLQFANCVVNYDLPWNPMRIEQRIGRVHRVTQRRDVYVANFFARGTIDEHVYRLLHDKLRMFELLFGQVTTILGELGGDRNEATFESQVLDAYLAQDDDEMTRRLEELGRSVDAAYQAAQTISAQANEASSWLVDRSHRSQIDGQARELMPDVEVTSRNRQREVQAFTEEWLTAVGASVHHAADDGSFLIAELPEGVSDDLGGRRQLCLAFSPTGLDHHRDAELCAVGSEVFESLVLALQDGGDLLVEVPESPDVDALPVPAALGATLVGREVHGPETWAAQVHWRVHAGESSLGEQVITTEMGDIDALATAEHGPLAAGNALPPTAGTAPELVRRLVDAALPDLQARQKELQTEADKLAAEERDRLLRSYDERLASSAPGRGRPGKPESEAELAKLRRTREIVAKQRAPDVQLRAEMLSVRLVGEQRVRVTETWRGATGAVGRLTCVWDPATGTRSDVRGDDGEPVDVVCVCSDGHVVDARSVQGCETCDRLHCAACDDQLAPAACPSCGTRACGTCRDGAGLCPRCHTPVRAEALDRDGMVAWTVGRGTTLLVGERVAWVGGQLVDALPEAHWPLGQRARAEARRRGLRPDLGVVSAAPPAPVELPAAAFAGRELGVRQRWVVDPHGGGDLDPAVASDLLDADDDGALPQSRSPLGGVIERLRSEASPAPAPRLVLDTVRSTGWLCIEDGRLHVVTRHDSGHLGHSGHDAEPVAEAVAVDWMPGDPTKADSVATATTPLGRLRLRRLHRSHVLEVEGGGSWFIPADDAADPAVEEVAAQLAHQVGLPPGAAVGLAEPEPFPDRVASPDGAPCVEFRIDAEWRLTGDIADHPLDRSELPAAEDGHEVYRSLPPEVVEELRTIARTLDRVEPAQPAALARTAIVSATWEGRSRVTRRFTSPAGDVARPPLDDTGLPAAEFAIDDHGHLCEPAQTWTCPSCETWRCRACGDAGTLAPCPACGQAACGSCRTSHHEPPPPASCARCGAVSCATCGRDLRAAPCSVCRRSTCARCRVAAMCATCSALAPASDGAIAALPAALVPSGLAVRVAQENATTVVALTGAARRELAVVVDGQIRQWWSIESDDDRKMRMLLAAAALVGRGDLRLRIEPTVRVPAWGDGCGGPAVSIVASHSARVTWTVSDPAGGRTLARSAHVTTAPSAADVDVLAALEASEALAGIRVPSPVTDPDHRQTLVSVLGPAGGTPQAVATIHVEEHVDETLVTTDGLVRRSGTPRHLGEDVAEWRPGPGAFVDAVAAWPLQPSATLHASLGQATAVVARVGPIYLLGTRIITGTPGPETAPGAAAPGAGSVAGAVAATSTATTSWHRLETATGTDDPLGPLRLAVRLGRPTACRVGRLVLPGDVTPFTVVNGLLRERTTEPVVRDVPAASDGSDPDATEAAVAFWAPHDLPELAGVAQLPTLPTDLVPRRWDELWPDDPTVDLGVGFREVWAVPDVGPVEVRYVVDGDRRVGLVQAHDTGTWQPALAVDRSGHLAEQPSPCGYCGTVTCVRCEAATGPCWLCGTAMCGRCGTLTAGGSACRACGSLGRLGWRGRRRKPTLEGAVLEGEDARHRVVVGPAASGARVLLVSADGDTATRGVALTPAQRDHLNDLARKALFP